MIDAQALQNGAAWRVRARRFVIVFTTLLLLAPFARPILAISLIDRAEWALVSGQYAFAQTYVERAVWLDPNAPDVMDAIGWLDGFEHLKGARLSGEIGRLSLYLRAHPTDVAVLTDRTLLEVRAHDYQAAMGDAQLAAKLDPTDYTIAALGKALQHKVQTP
jgi:hypothetical protein